MTHPHLPGWYWGRFDYRTWNPVEIIVGYYGNLLAHHNGEWRPLDSEYFAQFDWVPMSQPPK